MSYILQVGSRYSSPWTMRHKIRNALGTRDAENQLAGLIQSEMDKYIGIKREGIHSWHLPRGYEKTFTALS
jgi:hypothetical protein